MGTILFDQNSHSYIDQATGTILTSVTTLLARYGLAPDYSAVDPETLAKSAERGTAVHEDLNAFVRGGDPLASFFQETRSFASYCKEMGLKPVDGETIVSDTKIAGTYDVKLVDSYDLTILGDFKTTANLNREYVSWQLSLYNYIGGINADILMCYHFDKDGNMTPVQLAKKPDSEIIRLLDAYNRNADYTPTPLNVESLHSELEILTEAEGIIAAAKAQIEEAEAREKAVKQAIMQAMRDQGVSHFENDRISIALVEEGERVAIDTKRLKEEQPDIAKFYEKRTKVAPQVRIKLKKGN